eukprot:984281-Ditylum_brightwellii.AAC.1
MTRKPSRVMRRVTDRAIGMGGALCVSKAISRGENKEKSIVTTMAFVTMTLPSATLLNLTRNTFSQCTVSQNSRGSGRSSLLKTPKGAPRDAA